MSLIFTEHTRKPFVVEAVEVTDDNLEEIAKFIGDIEETPDGTRFIRVDNRLVRNIGRVHIGFWMTRMGEHIRCYNPTIFHDQFIELTDDIRPLVERMNDDG